MSVFWRSACPCSASAPTTCPWRSSRPATACSFSSCWRVASGWSALPSTASGMPVAAPPCSERRRILVLTILFLPYCVAYYFKGAFRKCTCCQCSVAFSGAPVISLWCRSSNVRNVFVVQSLPFAYHSLSLCCIIYIAVGIGLGALFWYKKNSHMFETCI